MKSKMTSWFSSFVAAACMFQAALLSGLAADGARQISLEGIGIPPINIPPIGGLPPILLSSVPTIGAVGVSVNTTVSFTFTVAMASQHAIAWSANVTPANFTYKWSADAKTLTCTYAGGFPANALIQWTLNPSSMTGGFAGQDGTALFDDLFQGMFTTGAGSGGSTNPPPVTPCNQTGNTNGAGGGSFNLSKSLNYVQTSTSAPALDSVNTPANFVASLNSPATNPVTAATLGLPNGSTTPLPNLFGNLFGVIGAYDDQAKLDAAYPNGTYALNLTRADASKPSVNVSFPAGGYPATPQIMNFSATQTWDPSADFNLQINGLGNPGANDDISFIITGSNGLVFQTPDPCVPRTLANTATAILIPKGTLAVGQTYQATLAYGRASAFDTNSLAGVVLFSGFQKTTNFKITTAGGAPPPTPPTLAIKQTPNGSFQITLTGQANVPYILESSPDIALGPWGTAATLSSPTGVSTYNVPATGLQAEWFRAHSP